MEARSMFCSYWVVIVALILLPSTTLAATIHVPGDQPTIQAGIDAAAAGDIVLVAPGIYYELVTITDPVVLMSEQGPDVTIIDGQLLATVINCTIVDGFQVEGFTIRNGATFGAGAGIRCDGSGGLIVHCRVSFNFSWSHAGGAGIGISTSAVTILDCDVTHNSAGGHGAGIKIESGSNVVVRNCSIESNETQSYSDGGGIYCDLFSTLLIEDSRFQDNLAHEGGGIAIVGSSTATMYRSVFVNNQATSPGVAGAAIIAVAADVRVDHCTFVGNISGSAGSTVCLYSGHSTFHHNIIADATGSGLQCPAHVLTSCNDVWNSGNLNYDGCGPAPTDFSLDPQFCDPGEMNFELNQSSPCAPGNSPDGCGLIGALHVGCGPVSVEPTTWGTIKASFN